MKLKRRLFVELLHAYGVTLASTYSLLFQAHVKAKPALTDKEDAFMKKTLGDLDAVGKRVTKLRSHMEHA